MLITFIVNDLKELYIEDPLFSTTFALIHASFMRGHTTKVCTPKDISADHTGVDALLGRITAEAHPDPAVFLSSIHLKFSVEKLCRSDYLFLRLPPPVDHQILALLTLLGERPSMINNPQGIYHFLYKCHPLFCADDRFIPKTLISKNKDRIIAFIDEHFSDRSFVLKPHLGKMGEGVVRIDPPMRDNLSSLLDYYIGIHTKKWTNHIVIQEYLHSENGDKRILLFDGKPIGAMRRLAKSGDHRNNIHAGAKGVKCSLDKEDHLIIETIAPLLRKHGLRFVGIDLLCDKLLEVNACATGGIPRINRLYNCALDHSIIELLEREQRHLQPDVFLRV